jgi:hypothetical protein
MTFSIDTKDHEPRSDDALTILPSLKDGGPRMLTPSEIDWLRQNLKASYKALLKIAEERDRQASSS